MVTVVVEGFPSGSVVVKVVTHTVELGPGVVLSVEGSEMGSEVWGSSVCGTEVMGVTGLEVQMSVVMV